MEPQINISNANNLTEYLGAPCRFERQGTWIYTPPYIQSYYQFEEPEYEEDILIRRSIEYHSKEGGVIPEFSFTGDKFGKISMWLKTYKISKKAEEFFKEQGVLLGHYGFDFLGKTKHIQDIAQIRKIFNILKTYHILPQDSYLKVIEEAIMSGEHEIDQQKESHSKQTYKKERMRYFDASIDIPMRIREQAEANHQN